MAVLYGSLIKNRFGFDSRCPYVNNPIGDGEYTVKSASGVYDFNTYPNTYQYSYPVTTKRVVTTVREYDSEGRVVKETTTEETTTTSSQYYSPQIYNAVQY